MHLNFPLLDLKQIQDGTGQKELCSGRLGPDLCWTKDSGYSFSAVYEFLLQPAVTIRNTR